MKKFKKIIQFIKQLPSNLNRLFKNYDKLDELRLAIIDPNGIGMLNLKMKTIGVPKNCFHVFYEMPKNAICIDGGANIGLFTDLCLFQGAKIHIFEPNNYLIKNIFAGILILGSTLKI